MSKVIVPENYKAALNPYDTQRAIMLIHSIFEKELCSELDLSRVSAPLMVPTASGLNDNLNGVERPVGFDIKETGEDCQVVQSLAKWKRKALKDYDFHVGKGLYTDMNAIRRDEEMDNLHSVYVDQWDWEKVITREERNEAYLQGVVRAIANAIYVTNETLKIEFPQLTVDLPRNVRFVTTQELEDLYPDLPGGNDRETAYLSEHRDSVVFLMGIGGALRSGKPHDGRAPDYDDWALNGDILYWNNVLGRAFEISSMGIRVDEESLDRQLTAAGCDERRGLPFHKALLAGELPLTIGGGIGQSRLCMLMMGCAHIGEVQSSIWDEATKKACADAGVMLL